MPLLPKLLRKINRLASGKIDFKDFTLQVTSAALNYFPFQRSLRRSAFPIQDVECRKIVAHDRAAYSKFVLENASAAMRRKNSFPEYVPVEGNDSDALLYIAKYEGRVVGNIYLLRRFPLDGVVYWEVNALAVLKPFQGKGIASKLLLTVLSANKQSGRLFYLVVDSQNLKALNLYRKIGFRQDAFRLAQCRRAGKLTYGPLQQILFPQEGSAKV